MTFKAYPQTTDDVNVQASIDGARRLYPEGSYSRDVFEQTLAVSDHPQYLARLAERSSVAQRLYGERIARGGNDAAFAERVRTATKSEWDELIRGWIAPKPKPTPAQA